MAQEKIASAIQLAVDGKSLTIDTSDSAYLGQTVTVTVTLSGNDTQRVRSAEQLTVEITFVDESTRSEIDNSDAADSES